MNWTGGRLSRHSRNANSALTQRQKKHFAKARSNLLNGRSKRSPIKWSLFDAADSVARGDGSKLNTTPRHLQNSPTDHAAGIQSTLRKRQQLKNCSGPTLPDASFQDKESLSPELEPCDRFLFDRVSNRVVDHTELSQSHSEIGRHELPPTEALGGNGPDPEPDSLEDRRLRILRKIDWVGANIQRPIKLKFTATGNDERLGKRRKISGSHLNNFDAIAQPIIPSAFTETAPRHNPERSLRTRNVNESRFEALPKNRVRISIGGRHVAAGATSSTSCSKKVGGHFVSSQASISDEMLLDGHDMSRQQSLLSQEKQDLILYSKSPLLAPSIEAGIGSFSPCLGDHLTGTRHRKKTIPSYDRSNSIIERPTSAEFIGLAGRIPAIRTGFNIPVADRPWQFNSSHSNSSSHPYRRSVQNANSKLINLRSHARGNDPSSRNLKHAVVNLIERDSKLSELLPHNPRFINDISRQLPSSARKLHSAPQEIKVQNLRIDSRPQLFHPIPLTSRTSQVLCRTLSESDSTVAQIGVDHTATQSQLLDEEIWKTWMLSCPGDATRREQRCDNEVSISPGVSNIGARCATAGSTEIINESTGESTRNLGCSSDMSDIHPVSASKHALLRPGSLLNNEDECDRSASITSTHESTQHDGNIPKSKVVDYRALFHQIPRQVLLSPVLKPARSENLDEAWMKFILSDDNDDDIEEEYEKINENPKTISPAVTQFPPQSSVIVHLSQDSNSSFRHGTATSSSIEATTTLNNTEGTIASLSRDGPQVLSYATYGSSRSSSDEFSSDAPSSINLIIYREAAPTSFPNTTPSRTTRKLTFTKPPRFPSPPNHGRESPKTTGGIAGSSSVHIGKSFSKRVGALAHGKGQDDGRRRGNIQRQCERDIYNLRDEHDVESVEDD